MVARMIVIRNEACLNLVCSFYRALLVRCVAGDRVCAGTNLNPKPIMKGFSATGGFDCVQFATLQHVGGIYRRVSCIPGRPRAWSSPVTVSAMAAAALRAGVG